MQYRQRLDTLEQRFEALNAQMADPEVINNPDTYRKTAKAHMDLSEVVEAYRQSIVVSFREVEDALSGLQQFALQESLLRQVIVHAREAYRLADARYKAGAVDFTTILDAQRSLLAAETAVDPVRLGRFTSLVGLFRALGGGWKDTAPRNAGAGPRTP